MVVLISDSKAGMKDESLIAFIAVNKFPNVVGMLCHKSNKKPRVPGQSGGQTLQSKILKPLYHHI